MFQPSKLDLTKTKTFSAANRHNLVRIDTLRTPGQPEDDLFDSPEFRILLQKLDAAQKAGKTITWILLIFMVCNMLVSGLALIRSTQRANGIAATSGWQEIMDERFDDERIQKIYPNAINTQ